MSANPIVNYSVAVADPSSPANAVRPLSDGSITVGGYAYETVAASTTSVLKSSGNGSIGDYVNHLLVTPATTSPGNVTLIDGNVSIVVFAGGASSVPNLIPFNLPIEAKSVVGAWSVTTGANVSVLATGKFT